MSDRRVLFVVEGEKAEPRFLRRMMSEVFGLRPENIFIYNTNIHELLRSMSSDDGIDGFLDLIQVLKEGADDGDREMLSGRFTDVFLVFDMDPHDQRFDERLLREAMEFFDDSADAGKLYINYPMLESYKHLSSLDDEGFLDRTVSMDDVKRYKGIVEAEGCRELKDLGRYTRDTFMSLISMNLRKANRILTGGRDLPTADAYTKWGGTDIFDAQNDLIHSEGRMFVLNTLLFNPVDFNPSRFLRP